jgi:hypothetical protein
MFFLFVTNATKDNVLTTFPSLLFKIGVVDPKIFIEVGQIKRAIYVALFEDFSLFLFLSFLYALNFISIILSIGPLFIFCKLFLPYH